MERGLRAKLKDHEPGWDLGRGEFEAIAWAYQHSGHGAILDDLAARKCARSLEIPMHGLVGLILMAKKRGLAPAANPLIEGLIKAEMWFKKKWVLDTLALVGE